MQMITNGGNNEGLFQGAVMQSGGPIPVGDINRGQEYYDFIVDRTGCRNHKDTLECLRRIPYTTYKKAMDESPNMFSYQVGAYIVSIYCVPSVNSLAQALILAWLPRVDGVFLTEPPQYSVLRGHVSNVPMITGVFSSPRLLRVSYALQETVTMRVLSSRSPRTTSRKYQSYLSPYSNLI